MSPLPTNAFSLAAIVRSSKEQSQSQKQQQYVLVHEKFPRGWWLPGGGIEYKDSSPVDAAVRETMEEAASPKCGERPAITHLLSLEQTPGRIRFIFRGEWCDDKDIFLKRPPGDEESIEAKWITWDELQNFKRRRKHIPREQWLDDGNDSVHQLSPTMSVTHPWLRAHEPLTFFGMLETSLRQSDVIPGLEIREEENEDKAVGAFFNRSKGCFEAVQTPTVEGRAVFFIHLQCRLLVYDSQSQQFAMLISFVENQNAMTLRQLTDEMISLFSPSIMKTGLLRVGYTSHENGSEATLTVFPFAIVSSKEGLDNDVSWVSKDDLADSLDRQLAEHLLSGGNFVDLNILRDTELGK